MFPCFRRYEKHLKTLTFDQIQNFTKFKFCRVKFNESKLSDICGQLRIVKICEILMRPKKKKKEKEKKKRRRSFRSSQSQSFLSFALFFVFSGVLRPLRPKKKRFLPSSAPFLLAFVPQQFASAAGMLALSSLHLTFMLAAAQRVPLFHRVSDSIVAPARYRHLKCPRCPTVSIPEGNNDASRGPSVTHNFHNEVECRLRSRCLN